MIKFNTGLPLPALIAIICCAVVLLIAIVLVIVLLKKNKKGSRITINDEFINNLISLLGEKDNITDVQVDNGRLKIGVSDLDKVNLEGIKAIATSGVFVTGNIIKTLFRLDSKTIKEEIDMKL